MTTVDMTKGKEWVRIVLFALPVFVSNLFQQLYNSVDSLIVGNYLGDECLAAVSSSGNLIFLFTSFFIGCFAGAGVVIANYFGQKNYDNMSKAIHTDIAFALVAGVCLTVIGYFLSPVLLTWMQTDPEVLPDSTKYFQWYFLLVIGVILYNCFSGILQAVGNSVMPLIFLVISSVTNVLLDLLFIGVFHMGVEGASIATGISQMLSALLCFIFLIRRGTAYTVSMKKVRFHKDMMSQIIKQGLPAGVMNSVIGLANVVVQANINTFGKVAMAGCGTYSKIEGFAFLPITSFTLALTTFTSQNLGAGEIARAKKGSRFGIICSITMAEIIGVIVFFTMPYLARMFSSTEEVIEFAVRQAQTECLFYCLLAFSHCVASVLRGAGRAFVPMLVMLSIWCIYRVAYINIAMAINHDILLIFIAYPMTWAMSSVIYFIIYTFTDWVHKKPYVKHDKEQAVSK